MARAPKSRTSRSVFSNGLTLVTEQTTSYQSLAVGFWVRIGTRHERPREAGMSHLLEHMLFKGTERRTALDIAREVDRVGGDFNAFTTREYTCFHITLLAKDADLAFDILGDIILHSDIDAEELERERKVILQEISMVADSPEELAHDLLFERLYGRTGLGRPILGTENSIRKMRRSDILKFFRGFYRPDQLVISVSGNLTHARAKKLIKPLLKRTSSWPGRPKNPSPRWMEKVQFKPIRQWEVRATEQAHVLWAFPASNFRSKDRFATLLLNAHLGLGMSSLLFQEIREKNGLAYTVYSNHQPFEDTGLFSIYAATSAGRMLACERLVWSVLDRLRSQLLSEEELEAVKENVIGTLLLQADSVDTRMCNLASSELYFRGVGRLEEFLEEIKKVSAQDLVRVAQRVFKEDHCATFVLGPKPTRSVRKRFNRGVSLGSAFVATRGTQARRRRRPK